MVKNTGFLTTKGSLIRGILYPRAVNFSFEYDCLKFVGLSAGFCLFTVALCMPLEYINGVSARYMSSTCLTLLMTAVPAAIPAAISCGVVFATTRLK